MHGYFYAKLKQQLDGLRDKKIILVIHVLPIKEFTVQPPNRMWSYLNAFLGSAQYGKLALEYAVPYVICGHVHYRMQKRIDNSEFICNCLNYSDQWIKSEPDHEVAEVLKVIDIG
jgi:Icc-related predicted phosphoesterase